MPFITEFKSPEGEKLPIAASKLITVEIPAAGGNLGDWSQAAASGAWYNQQACLNAPRDSAVIPHCTDPSVFTDRGLRIDYEEQLDGWVLWIDSLPAEACTLTLLFINHSTEDTPVVLPALGVGGRGGGGLPVVEIVSVLSKEPTGESSLFGELSEGETNALTAAAQANSPIIVKFPFTLDGETVIGATLVFGRYDTGDSYLYQAEIVALADDIYKILVVLFYEDGAWIYSGLRL